MHFHGHARAAAPLRQDGETAKRRRIWRSNNAFGDFLLKHQRKRCPARWPWLAGQPIDEQCGADIIGQIGHDMPAGLDNIGQGNRHRIAFDDPQSMWMNFAKFGKRRQASPVTLDDSHIRPGIDQRAGQATGAGADFIDRLPFKAARHSGNAVEQLAVEQEVLAERLARGQPVTRDDIAERRAFAGHAARCVQACSARQAVACDAILMAAIIAPGFATFCPAMPNAVP